MIGALTLSTDGQMVILLLAVTLGLSCALLYLALRQRRFRQRQILLESSIRHFLEQSVAPAYSLSDDSFASLENAVADLENHLLLTQARVVRENRQHADFLADISHQLKTPLAAMRLYCELDGDQTPHQQEQLELTLHMEKLIQSLLRMEKLKADAYPMNFQPCSLRILVEGVWDELQPLFPDRCLAIRGDGTARLDTDWMSEAIQNILKNAGEHPAGNPVIDVDLAQTDAAVTITIADHGGGIPEPAANLIFERFHRTSQNRSPGNVGLGLAIARTIIEKHHGTVFAENRGDGLCMTICLPLTDGRRAW